MTTYFLDTILQAIICRGGATQLHLTRLVINPSQLSPTQNLVAVGRARIRATPIIIIITYPGSKKVTSISPILFRDKKYDGQ